MLWNRLGLLLVLFFALGAVLCVMQAQTGTTGDIAGLVTDSSGAVVPNATVTVKSLDTGESRTAQTSATGEYRLTLLRPASYQISSASPGLKSDIARVNVMVGRASTVNLVMKPEAGKEVIEVSETATILQTENANIATSYNRDAVQLLPMPGGDMTTVALTVPGVVVNAGTGWGYGNFSSNGLPGLSNLFTTNGNDTNDAYLNLNNSGASNLMLGANEVDQVSVVQNAYSVQFGRQAGAQVNYLTKSGTNDYHGSLNYTYNGSVLNANDFFANQTGTPKSRALSNQWGADFGGHIIKNKLFFYGDTEGIRFVLPTASVISLPSQALQTYVLANLPAAQKPYYQKAFGLYNAAPGRNRAVSVVHGDGTLQDSYTYAVDGTSMGCGGLGGTPNGTGGVFGLNVSCADAFMSNVSNQNKEWLMSTRVDYNLSSKHTLFFRFKMDHGLQPTETSPISSTFNSYSNQPAYEGQVNHTWVVSSHAVNNFIGSGSWYSAIFTPNDVAAATALFPSEWYFNGDGGANGTGGFTQMGMSYDTYPQGRRAGQLQLSDNFSYLKGRHTIKAGVNYRYNRITDTGNQRYVSGGRYLFYSVADMASGVIDPNSGTQYAQRYTPFQAVHLRSANTGYYIQDEWAARRDLKLTLGLRLDHTSNPYCTDKCYGLLTAPFASISHGSTIPYNQSITPNNGNAFYSTQAVVYQPRIGVAYNPGKLQNTVIRGGFGLFADQPPLTLASFFTNSPNVFTPAVRAGTVDSGGAGSAVAISIATGKAFQSGFSSGATLAQLQASLAPVTFTPPAYTSVPDKMLVPKYEEWSLEVEQKFGANNVFSVAYAGNHGYDTVLRNLNANAYASAANYPRGLGGLPTAAVDTRFRIVTQFTNAGHSNYHGLSFEFRRALAKGFMGHIGYTWSHGLDNVSNGGSTLYFNADSLTSQINPFNPDNPGYGSSDYDVRHNITADFVYQIPMSSKNLLVKGVLGGWSVSSKLFARTGMPFSVYNSLVGARSSSSTGGTFLSDLLNSSVATSCTSVDQACFKTTDFTTRDQQFDFGNLSRNSFRGPGYFDIDSSVYKGFALAERFKFRFGASFYNLLNHPNFGNPNSNAGGSGFGTITATRMAPNSPYGTFFGSAVSGRVVVLTGKVDF